MQPLPLTDATEDQSLSTPITPVARERELDGGAGCRRVTVTRQRITGKLIQRTVEDGPALDVATLLFQALCPQLNRMVAQLSREEERVSATAPLPADEEKQLISRN